MSSDILAPVARQFALDLRRALKGWSVFPAICTGVWGGKNVGWTELTPDIRLHDETILAVKRRHQHVSPWDDFFATPPSKIALVLCNFPGYFRRLSVLSVDDKLHVSLFHLRGYKRTQDKFNGTRRWQNRTFADRYGYTTSRQFVGQGF